MRSQKTTSLQLPHLLTTIPKAKILSQKLRNRNKANILHRQPRQALYRSLKPPKLSRPTALLKTMHGQQSIKWSRHRSKNKTTPLSPKRRNSKNWLNKYSLIPKTPSTKSSNKAKNHSSNNISIIKHLSHTTLMRGLTARPAIAVSSSESTSKGI